MSRRVKHTDAFRHDFLSDTVASDNRNIVMMCHDAAFSAATFAAFFARRTS